ncbi:hypothetical protein FIBSPDRAFT_333619 [Athelia psychrophila]|uniref:Uncharacterized protein n=1 Tax=Athelia psychrophila TaxID=1759441 RepID=A0A166Q4I2_9AGAM|nr:hypothetical protein FIBSPDRAFT_333619 [Fibularhizoctonia sp. CBS 109695]
MPQAWGRADASWRVQAHINVVILSSADSARICSYGVPCAFRKPEVYHYSAVREDGFPEEKHSNRSDLQHRRHIQSLKRKNATDHQALSQHRYIHSPSPDLGFPHFSVYRSSVRMPS